jgi:hypothetical protein
MSAISRSKHQEGRMRRAVFFVLSLVAACLCRDAAAQDAKPQILLVELQCDGDGELTGMVLAGRRIEQPKDKERTRFDELTKRLRAILEKTPGVPNPGEFIIEIDAPENLKYENIIQTFSAVNWYVPEKGGEPRPLAKKVRFKLKDDKDKKTGIEFKLPKLP